MRVPMFWTGLVVGVGLALLAVALTLGVGMIAYRAFMDSTLGHAWRDDWEQTMKRWGIGK